MHDLLAVLWINGLERGKQCSMLTHTWMPIAVPRNGVPPYRAADRAMAAVSTAAHPRPGQMPLPLYV